MTPLIVVGPLTPDPKKPAGRGRPYQLHAPSCPHLDHPAGNEFGAPHTQVTASSLEEVTRKMFTREVDQFWTELAVRIYVHACVDYTPDEDQPHGG